MRQNDAGVDAGKKTITTDTFLNSMALADAGFYYF